MAIPLLILANAPLVARAAAEHVATAARQAIAERGRFVMAVSGGSTPWGMLRSLAEQDLPWSQIYLLQVDERVAPAGDEDRNLTHLLAALRDAPGFCAEQVCPLPVEMPDLDAAADQYAATLCALAGTPAVLDLVHLGLGGDGHTASLVPDDPVLSVTDRLVAATGEYQGRRRLTLTYPAINSARQILWLITGANKRAMLPRLLTADPTIPAGRINQTQAIVIADKAACP